VDSVADRLADQVGTNGVALQVVAVQEIAFGADVVGIGHRAVDFEVVAPAGEFQAAVAEIAGLLGQGFARKISPLAGKERDGSCHDFCVGWGKKDGTSYAWGSPAPGQTSSGRSPGRERAILSP